MLLCLLYKYRWNFLFVSGGPGFSSGIGTEDVWSVCIGVCTFRMLVSVLHGCVFGLRPTPTNAKKQNELREGNTDPSPRHYHRQKAKGRKQKEYSIPS